MNKSSHLTELDDALNKLEVVQSIHNRSESDVLYTMLHEDGLMVVSHEAVIEFYEIAKAKGYLKGAGTAIAVMGAFMWLKNR